MEEMGGVKAFLGTGWKFPVGIDGATGRPTSFVPITREISFFAFTVTAPFLQSMDRLLSFLGQRFWWASSTAT